MNIQERIEALETEFAEKIKALKAEAQQEQEFPRDGDEYWIIESTGEIDNGTWEGNDIDNEFLAVGNVFKTREQAEFAVEKLKVEAELRKYSTPYACGESFTLNYHIKSKCLVNVGADNNYKDMGGFYFKSNDKINEAIRTVGVDRIKKYIFGVE